MNSESDYNRIRWASRRGMLELDLILVPFVENCFKGLDEKNRQRYINLLEGEDTDLFFWFLGRGQPEDPELRCIVDQIVRYARQKKDDI